MGILGVLVFSFILTAAAYMAFPLIKLNRNHGKFEKKRAKKIALWNSIAVGAFFFVLTAFVEEDPTWSSTPAFLYYWINRAILTDKGNKTGGVASVQPVVTPAPITRPPQISDPDEPQKSYGNFSTPASDLKLQPNIAAPSTEGATRVSPDMTTPPLKPQFCRKCGFKLLEESKFCSYCGTAVVEEVKNVLP